MVRPPGASKAARKNRGQRRKGQLAQQKLKGDRRDKNDRKCKEGKKRNSNRISAKQKEPSEDVMLSIEEQLRKQREEQRKRKESSAQEVEKPADGNEPPAKLGGYIYGRERKTYYPSHSLSSKLQRIEQAEDDPKTNPVKPIQPHHPALSYLAETCLSKARRMRIRDVWAGRILYNSLQVVSVANPRAHTNSNNFNEDLSCKSLLHPSCRTFDVTPITVTRRPLIATLTNPHEIMFSTKLVFRCMSDNHTAVRHLPLLKGRPGTTHTGYLSHDTYPNREGIRFALFAVDDKNNRLDSTMEQYLHSQAAPNDFCQSKDDTTIVMAPTRSNRNAAPKVSMIHVIHQQATVHKEPDLPKSDAFCIEGAPIESLSSGACAIGYRNGQVAVWDGTRGKRSCLSTSTTERKLKAEDTFRAATSLSWLSNGNQVLARGSLGDCHLYDIRRMGSSATSLKQDPSLLYKLSAPSCFDSVRSKVALYCNGVVLDPSETVAITPLLTPLEVPCFGFWSLKTGEWIGSKHLHSGVTMNAASSEKPPPFLELCGVATPSYAMTGEGEIFLNPLDKNSFGLWFKCGRAVLPTDGVSSQALSSRALKFCNIYHMSMTTSASRLKTQPLGVCPV